MTLHHDIKLFTQTLRAASQHLDIKLEFVASDSFKKQFDTILQHDREIFEEPAGWQTKAISESPLVNDFSNLWQTLKEKYQTELSALAYRPIPNENDVAKCFEELISMIKD